MKPKYSVSFAACLFATLTLITWCIWSASVTAQSAAPPEPEGASSQQIASPGYGQSQVVPRGYSPSQQPVPVTGTPIGLPAGSQQYRVVTPRHPGYSMPGVAYAYPATATTDAKTLELIAAYQKQQGEINQLVKSYGAAKSEEDKDSVRDQIVQATTVQFELRQQVRERELEQLKKRLTDVETTVQKRNELKEEIVEKRVADILREPDQLQWESLGTSYAPTYPGSLSTPIPGQVVPLPGTTLVPRTTVRIEQTTVIDEEGNEKVVRRPVKATEYVQIDPTGDEPATSRQTPSDSVPPGSVVQINPSPLNSFDAPGLRSSDYRSISPTNMTVAEAEARVRFAEAKRDQLRGKGGDKIDRSELKSLEAELDLAKLILARTQVEYEGRTKLLELDVRQAEANCEQARAALAEATEINKRSRHAIPEPQVVTLRAAVEQANISLERANTVLEFHQKTNRPTRQVDDPTVPRYRSDNNDGEVKKR